MKMFESKKNPTCRPALILEIKCDIDGAQIEMAGLSIYLNIWVTK